MPKEKKNVKKIPPVVINPDIKQIYLTGAFGGFTPHDFRIILFNEKAKVYPEATESVDLIRDASHELIMSHLTAKELYTWLGKQLNEYEESLAKSVAPDPSTKE